MLIQNDFEKLGAVPDSILRYLRDSVTKTDWMNSEFDRNDGVLISRVVRLDCGIRKEIPQPDSVQITRLRDQLSSIRSWLQSKKPDHVMVKAEISALMPQTELLFHVDPCWWHQHCHRIHIPVVTNTSSRWMVEDREHFLEVGYYYEVNNRRYHTYVNKGDAVRVHCVFDWMPRESYDMALRENIDIDKLSVNWQDQDLIYKDKKKFLRDLPRLKQLSFS